MDMIPKEQKRFANSKEKNCPWCGKLNPPTAFVCHNCMKVMKDKYKVPFWYIQLRVSVVSVVIGASLMLAGSLVYYSYTRAKDAEEVIFEQNAVYNTSIENIQTHKENKIEKQRATQLEKEFSMEELTRSVPSQKK